MIDRREKMIPRDEVMKPNEKNERALKRGWYIPHRSLDRYTIEDKVFEKNYYDQFDVSHNIQESEKDCGTLWNVSEITAKSDKLLEEYIRREENKEIRNQKIIFKKPQINNS
jgi:hypothetical protein